MSDPKHIHPHNPANLTSQHSPFCPTTHSQQNKKNNCATYQAELSLKTKDLSA